MMREISFKTVLPDLYPGQGLLNLSLYLVSIFIVSAPDMENV